MEGKSERGFVCFDGLIVPVDHRCGFCNNLCRMGAQNVGLTAANINHNIYTTLMFYETEF